MAQNALDEFHREGRRGHEVCDRGLRTALSQSSASDEILRVEASGTSGAGFECFLADRTPVVRDERVDAR
jgi:hypothetical protein